jgi:outer membrane protein assembly factor BamB
MNEVVTRNLALSTSSIWPKFRGDLKSTGKSQYVGPSTNDTFWKYKTGGYVHGSAAIDGNGTIYIGSFDNYVYSFSSTGGLRWKFLTGSWVYSSPAIDDGGNVYVGSEDAYLYAIDSEGTQIWSYRTTKLIDSSPTITMGDIVVVASFDGCIYGVTRSNGKLYFRYCTNGVIFSSSPSIGDDGSIYIGSDDKNVYSIAPNGALLWVYKTNGKIETTPAVGNNGVIYVGSQDSHLYAISSHGSYVWSFPGTSIRLFTCSIFFPMVLMNTGLHSYPTLFCVYMLAYSVHYVVGYP